MILYYYLKTGMTVGPVTLEELRNQLTAGELTEDCLACPAGAEDWEPLRVILAKAPEEEQPLPPKDLSRIHSMARAAAERDVRAIGWGSDQSEPIARWISAPTSPGTVTKREPMKLRHLLTWSNLLLASIATLLLILCVMSRNPPLPTYEYKWMHVSRDDFQTVYDWNKHHSDTYKFELDGWEYVGPLCNDGINASFILLRRPK